MMHLLVVLLPVFMQQNVVDSVAQMADPLQAYHQLLAGDSLMYEETVALARQLAHNDHWEAAIQLYSLLLEDYPDDPDLLLGRGLAYAWDGLYTDAKADLIKVTHGFPAYADAWMALGNVYLWWDFPEKAISPYSEWADLQPESPLPYFSRAKAYRTMRNFSQARKDLFRAQRLGGDQDATDQLLREMDRIPGAWPWEPRILLEYDAYSDDRPNWNSATFSIKRELPAGSFSLGLIRARRFNQTDTGILMDCYLNLWRRAYGNFRLQLVPERKVLPGSDATLEVYQGFGRGWEISGSYRRMVYPMKIVQLYGTTLARYTGQWYIRGVVHYVPKNAGADLFMMVIARRYLSTVDDFLELGSGFGTEVETGRSGPLFTSSEVYSARAQRFLHPRLGITVNASFQRTSRYDRWSLAVGLITRW